MPRKFTLADFDHVIYSEAHAYETQRLAEGGRLSANAHDVIAYVEKDSATYLLKKRMPPGSPRYTEAVAEVRRRRAEVVAEVMELIAAEAAAKAAEPEADEPIAIEPTGDPAYDSARAILSPKPKPKPPVTPPMKPIEELIDDLKYGRSAGVFTDDDLDEIASSIARTGQLTTDPESQLSIEQEKLTFPNGRKPRPIHPIEKRRRACLIFGKPTRKQLAERAGLHESWLCRLFNGKNKGKPSARSLARLDEAMKYYEEVYRQYEIKANAYWDDLDRKSDAAKAAKAAATTPTL